MIKASITTTKTLYLELTDKDIIELRDALETARWASAFQSRRDFCFKLENIINKELNK